MSIMKINWITFCSRTCIVLLLSVYSTTENEIVEENEKKCSFDFTSHAIKTSQGSKLMCVKLFLERMAWDEAKLRCTLLFSQLTQRIYLNSSLYTELLDEDVDLLWIGIHRRANFFITEYPSKLFREVDEFSLDHWGYHWSEDEPGFGDCVAVNTRTGSLHTRDCKEHLPFICDYDESLKSTVPKDLCPKEWLLSFSLSTVFRTCIHPYKAYSHSKAKRICNRYGAHLASWKEYDILDSTDQIIRNYLMKAGKFWILKEKKNDPCRINILGSHTGDVNKVADVNCSNSYPFICVKYYQTERITAHLSPNSLPPIATDSLEGEDLLKCDLDTDYLKKDKNGEVRFQWYKDDLPVFSNSYVIRIGFTGSALKRDPYIWDVVIRQGNYHCEVTVAGSPKTYSSSKLKFSYSDIATFMIEIQNIKYIKSLDFSHQDFTKRMEEFEDAFMSRVLGKLKLQYPRTQWDFNSIRLQNGTAIMKILVYIHRNNADDFDDITACEEIKEAFAEQQSIPVYLGNATFRVNCREFTDAGGYNKIMKNLKEIKKKLDNMEETQTNILGKLNNMELIQPDNTLPTEKKFAFDIELILRAAEDLKRLSKSLFTNSLDDTHEAKTVDTRERNVLEDTLPFLGSKKYPITSEKSQKMGLISFEGSNPHSKSHGIVSSKEKE